MGLPNAPGWDADPVVASWPGLPELSGSTTSDACVVGIGGSGLAAVEELATRGLSVVAVDAGRVAAAGGVGAGDGERARELADCAAQAAALREHGVAVEEHSGPLGSPDDAQANPAARHLGVLAPVQRVAPGRVETERGVVSAGAVVVAVDGRLEALLPQVAGVVRTGSTEPTAAVQAHVDRVAELLLGRALAPGEVTHRWGASVGYTAPERAGRAFCGLVDERGADGVAAVGGCSGTGNLVGPVAARTAVRLLLDGQQPPSCVTSLEASRGHGR